MRTDAAQAAGDDTGSAMNHSASVPLLVRTYLERAVPSGGGAPERIRITQEGEMRQLIWRELDGARVEVATRAGPEEVSVRLEFDAAGDIVRVAADARPRAEGGTAPWAGTFDAYRYFGGIRIPTRAEVSWLLPEGRFTYFRGTVTSLESIAGPPS